MDELLPHGLRSGRPYCVSRVEKVVTSIREETVTLLRLRDPWGRRVEWSGDWSQGSAEWGGLALEERTRLQAMVAAEDGEFWMSWPDFAAFFSQLTLCYLVPESAQELAQRRWRYSQFHGVWTAESSGGRPSFGGMNERSDMTC